MAVIITPQGHALGWRPDLPDHRDFAYAAPTDVLKALPSSVDLRSQMPDPYDQEAVGSCTANAINACIQFNRRLLNAPDDFIPSRLFVYWNERDMEHTVPMDAGAELRDGVKSVAKLGVCREDLWPYIATPADPATYLFPPGSPPVTKPSPSCYVEAKLHTAISYLRVQQSLSQLRGCLAQGFPFVFGFSVYTSMYDVYGKPVTELPLPSSQDDLLGGHAVCAVGYDDEDQTFTIRNSWGTNVQDQGHFYMSYSFITDHQLASDFWTIRRVSG